MRELSKEMNDLGSDKRERGEVRVKGEGKQLKRI